MATSELQIVLQRAAKLSPVDKVKVIKSLADSLTTQSATPVAESRYLIYGEFAESDTLKMSTEDDFKIAEWHPSEAELNGD